MINLKIRSISYLIGILFLCGCGTEKPQKVPTQCSCSLQEETKTNELNTVFNGTTIGASIDAALTYKDYFRINLNSDIERDLNRVRQIISKDKDEVDSLADSYNLAIKTVCAREKICRCQENGSLSQDSIIANCNKWIEELSIISSYLLDNLRSKSSHHQPKPTVNLPRDKKSDVKPEGDQDSPAPPTESVVQVHKDSDSSSAAEVSTIEEENVEEPDIVHRELPTPSLFTVRIAHNAGMNKAKFFVDGKLTAPTIRLQNVTELQVEAGTRKFAIEDNTMSCEASIYIKKDKQNISVPCQNIFN